ncbi:SDR family oxidoreductase [Amycolatopsis azurea]|uniref:Short-chain dehydrogenase n=1 Tax=Amycolatopsis azurea DSM 43854 TaxID=1238180 RepID=M2QMD6_9PSEU|nr:SDR family oxidoreductase [Amycolatopsis azurea]EMD26977.1 Short-chain dehydrogenase/reductase SDR [Amycolatopsis azurea DSM 43854]OOC08799.1 short-chain dehydrogenase [Amycolatopsis azurea DSM 43854]
MTNTSAPHSGRVAVITGASSGIGEATARRLAASGAAVALIARRADRLETLAKEIDQDGGTALVLAADVADAGAMRAAAAEVEAKLGRADLLFNNAGVMLAAPIDELATGDWQRMIDVNMTGLMNAIGAFMPHLVASAAEKGVADLVNTSSIGAQAIFPSFGVYVASKAFVTHLSKNLRADLGPKNVRVAAIEPGLVETELQGHVTDAGALEWLDGVRETVNWLKPGDIAETVAFLTSLPARVNLQQVTVMPTSQV